MLEVGLVFLKFALAFACILVLPGMLLFNLLFNRKEHEFFEIVPVAMAFSIGLVSFAGIVLFLFKLNVDALLRLLPVLLVLLIILNIAKWRRTARARAVKGEISANALPGRSVRRRSFTIGVCALLLCAVALMVYRGGMFVWTSDTYDHVGTVREIMEKREILPADAYYGGAEHLKADPRKGLFHTCLAIICIVTKIEPFQIWLWLPIVLLPILICSYLTFANSLFKNRNIALLSSVLFVICFGGLDRSALRAVGYPLNVANILYLIALYFMFKYLENKRARVLFASALLGCAIALVHIYYFFQFLLALASLFVFSWLFRKEDKRLACAVGTLGLVTLVLSAPLLVLRYKLSYAIANPFDLQARHLLFFTKSISITDPLEAWQILAPIGILAFGATPFLFRRAKADDGILFLFCGMVTTPLIVFNPLAVYVLGRVMTYGLVRRITLFAPYIAVMGFFVYQALCSLRSRIPVRSALKAVAFLSLVAMLLIPYARAFVREYSPASVEYEQAHSYLPWRDALKFMQDRIAEPSMILSDPLTSFSIPAFTRHNIVAVLIGHSSPQDAENVNRVVAASDVLNPYVDMERTIAMLNKYHVQYIVVNQTFTSPFYETFWGIDIKDYEAARYKFESLPRLFEQVWARNKVYIYKYHPGEGRSELGIRRPVSRPFLLEQLPRPREAANAIFLDHFELMGAGTDKERVSRGDSLTMRCYWKCNSADSAIKYYKIFVRFDTQYKKSILYSSKWSKIYRIILQKMAGTRYRFRSEHNPVNGVYPPRLWRAGDLVEDEFRIVVPRDVSRGRYNIRIKLLSLPFSPNYTIRDLCSDNDMYEGAIVGTVIVE